MPKSARPTEHDLQRQGANQNSSFCYPRDLKAKEKVLLSGRARKKTSLLARLLESFYCFNPLHGMASKNGLKLGKFPVSSYLFPSLCRKDSQNKMLDVFQTAFSAKLSSKKISLHSSNLLAQLSFSSNFFFAFYEQPFFFRESDRRKFIVQPS